MRKYKSGDTIEFNEYVGIVFRITETYRKNLLTLKLNKKPKTSSTTILILSQDNFSGMLEKVREE